MLLPSPPPPGQVPIGTPTPFVEDDAIDVPALFASRFTMPVNVARAVVENWQRAIFRD